MQTIRTWRAAAECSAAPAKQSRTAQCYNIMLLFRLAVYVHLYAILVNQKTQAVKQIQPNDMFIWNRVTQHQRALCLTSIFASWKVTATFLLYQCWSGFNSYSRLIYLEIVNWCLVLNVPNRYSWNITYFQSWSIGEDDTIIKVERLIVTWPARCIFLQWCRCKTITGRELGLYSVSFRRGSTQCFRICGIWESTDSWEWFSLLPFSPSH